MAQPQAYKTLKAKAVTERDPASYAETAETNGRGELAEQDKWLLNSPETMASIKRGLADSAAGRGVKKSFIEFADDED